MYGRPVFQVERATQADRPNSFSHSDLGNRRISDYQATVAPRNRRENRTARWWAYHCCLARLAECLRFRLPSGMAVPFSRRLFSSVLLSVTRAGLLRVVAAPSQVRLYPGWFRITFVSDSPASPVRAPRRGCPQSDDPGEHGVCAANWIERRIVHQRT
jgi:hypothetical protein